MAPRSEPLDEYRRKRDFAGTPEPAGSPAGDAAPALRFVVQEHHATALHWDLRLEHNGVLASWAVPKGVPVDPRTNHLAVHTEDHPLEYLDFHGRIPEGNYGAGRMTVWDQGTYELEKWEDREVMVVLHGERVDGRYVLFGTNRRGGRDWMIHRMDPPADPSREPTPTGLEAMLPTPGPLPRGKGWLFEPAWPGRRLIVPIEGGRPDVGAGSRTPELGALAAELGTTPALLDTLVVTLGEDGRPDRSPPVRGRGRQPLLVVIVDLLWLDGHSLMEGPLTDRRERLEETVPAGPSWLVTPQHRDGSVLLEAATANGFDGIIAKRARSPYRPGRSADWREVRAPS